MPKKATRTAEAKAGLEAPVLLQADNFTPRARTPWGGHRIAEHYTGLEYHAIAEAVYKQKGDGAVETADEYAAYRLAGLREEQARRELARFLKRYGSAEKLERGPALEEALSAYRAFIKERLAG